jgi:ribonucleoside-diphosphate reductase beta chain
MRFALSVVDQIRAEEPDLFDAELEADVARMLDEAVEVEATFAEDLLSGGVSGLSLADTREYLRFVADQRLGNLGMAPRYGARNPFDFMALQDVQELANFFERRVSAYQVGVTGEVALDEDF